MKDIQVNHKWISARSYAKQTGLGEEKVKQFIKAGKIEGLVTEDGYYKVKVFNNDSVSKNEYESLKEEYVELKTKFSLIKEIMKGDLKNEKTVFNE